MDCVYSVRRRGIEEGDESQIYGVLEDAEYDSSVFPF